MSLLATAFLLVLSDSVTGAQAAPVPEPRFIAEAGNAVDQVEVDKEKVRYGDLAKFDPSAGHKVGTVRSKEIYEKIPAYKKIKEEDVKEGTARWNQLMKEATDVYKKVLKKTASDGDYKLIVEEGGISGYSTTDLTETIISAVETEA